MGQAFFISYSSADAAQAREICAFLQSLSADYWIAPDNILPGEPFPVAIARAIRDSLAVFLLFSRSSDQSADVLNEITLARNHRKRVVPVRLEDYRPVNLEYYLGVPQWVDFYGSGKTEGQQRLRELVDDLRGAEGSADTPALTVSADLKSGDPLAGHTLLGEVAVGGFGRVYRARDNSSGRIDALWVLDPTLSGNEELLKLCRAGLQIQAQLQNPAIARVFARITVGTRPAVITEYIEGNSVEALLQTGPIPADQTIRYAVQVLSMLSYLHARGVTHRNLKPGTLMITPSGQPKLIGFHLAYQRGIAPPPNGQIIGTVQYMPPEQIHGEEPTPRSDIYSLGVTLYEMVTGRQPFGGGSDFEVMQAHLNEIPPSPMEVSPGVPRELDDAIMIAMAKDPAARFASADAMRDALAGSALAAGQS